MSQLLLWLGINELSTKPRKLCQALLAEFIGSFLVNFIGSASGFNVARGPDAEPNPVLVSLTVGFTVFALISATFHISGGHLSPTVTLGLVSIGKVNPMRGSLYVVMQCAGAIAGVAAIKTLTPEAVIGRMGVTTLGKNVTHLQGFIMEFFLSFTLLFIACGVCDPYNANSNVNVPLTIGLTVSACHLCALDYTGPFMNPARSFGSALVSGIWIDHWMYWAAPLAGAIAGSLMYNHAMSSQPDELQPTSYKAVATETHENIPTNQLPET